MSVLYDDQVKDILNCPDVNESDGPVTGNDDRAQTVVDRTTIWQWPLLNRLAWRTRLVAPLRGHILEIGCGHGPNFREYHRACQVAAIEPDTERSEEAAYRAGQAQASVRVYQARAEELPFAAHRFDCVLSCLVLCSVGEPHATLAEIQRVLKPGGQLVLLEHVIPTTPALARLAHRITPAWSSALGNCHPNRDTTAILAHQGWDVQQLHRRTCIIRGAVSHSA